MYGKGERGGKERRREGKVEGKMGKRKKGKGWKIRTRNDWKEKGTGRERTKEKVSKGT